MQRNSTILLIVCGAGAFFMPLVARFLMQPGVASYLDPAKAQHRQPGYSAGANRVPQQQQPVQRRQNSATGQQRQVDGAVQASYPPSYQAQQMPAYQTTGGANTANPAIPTQLPGSNGVVQRANWLQPSAAQVGQNTDPLPDPRSLLIKLAIATSVVLVLCVASLQIVSLVNKSKRQSASELEVCDSLAISRDSGVKLIRIGNERIVVGHDRQGLRSMVLLPARFDQLLEEEQKSGNPHGAIEIAGDLRMALANPEDKGWDLNRLKS